MILYIRSLGFSEYDTKIKAETLVGSIIEAPDVKYVWETKDGTDFVEYYKAYGKGFGLTVRGIISEDEEINVHSLIPSTVSQYMIDTHEVDVVQMDEQDVYHAFCEEINSGTPMSFFLQNLKEYSEVEQKSDVYVDGVSMSGYCVDGTVVLPIDKTDVDELLDEEEEMLRRELLEQARKGDEDAMNILDEEADEASKTLQERLRNEDILSILEGFFVPVGDSDDVYSILGTIEHVELLTNRDTNEEIFHIDLTCMSIPIEIYINKDDLVGQPTPGMRFKGTSWLHGSIRFQHEENEG